MKRVHELTGEDYAFMRAVKFKDSQVDMSGADKASGNVPGEKLALGFRNYVSSFLHLVEMLTSDVLMERGKL